MTIAGYASGTIIDVAVNSTSTTDSVFSVKLNNNIITDDTSGRIYPVGLPVMTLDPTGSGVVGPVTFSIGGTPKALLRNGALFASGIEDMQVVWLYSDGTEGTAFAPGGIRITIGVRISLTAYVRDPDPNWNGGRFPGSENRAPGVADRFRRLSLSRTVQLKNISI